MLILLSAFIASTITCLCIYKLKHFHAKYSYDLDFKSPQKIHTNAVPRIGGIGVMAGLYFSSILYSQNYEQYLAILLCLSAAPVFLIGFAEDITKSISVEARLVCMVITGLIFCYAFNIYSLKIDFIIIDYLLTYKYISIPFIVFSIVGLVNSYNIIDGFNGLSSVTALISSLTLSAIGYLIGDNFITLASISLAGSLLGFVIFNYPKANLFLGDCGAYLLGFYIAALSILLVSRNELVSPWSVLLINAYPIYETLFSMYRRSIHMGKSASQPDRLHLHTLIYRRIIKSPKLYASHQLELRNSKTAPYLWAISLTNSSIAIIFYNSTTILAVTFLIFVLIYNYIYKKIINF